MTDQFRKEGSSMKSLGKQRFFIVYIVTIIGILLHINPAYAQAWSSPVNYTGNAYGASSGEGAGENKIHIQIDTGATNIDNARFNSNSTNPSAFGVQYYINYSNNVGPYNATVQSVSVTSVSGNLINLELIITETIYSQYAFSVTYDETDSVNPLQVERGTGNWVNAGPITNRIFYVATTGSPATSPEPNPPLSTNSRTFVDTEGYVNIAFTGYDGHNLRFATPSDLSGLVVKAGPSGSEQPLTISSSSVESTSGADFKLKLTMSNPLKLIGSNESVIVEYTNNGGLKDIYNQVLESFTLSTSGGQITNNSSINTSHDASTYSQGFSVDTSGQTLTYRLSSGNFYNISDASSQLDKFTITADGNSVGISSITPQGTDILVFTLSDVIYQGQDVTIGYSTDDIHNGLVYYNTSTLTGHRTFSGMSDNVSNVNSYNNSTQILQGDPPASWTGDIQGGVIRVWPLDSSGNVMLINGGIYAGTDFAVFVNYVKSFENSVTLKTGAGTPSKYLEITPTMDGTISTGDYLQVNFDLVNGTSPVVMENGAEVTSFSLTSGTPPTRSGDAAAIMVSEDGLTITASVFNFSGTKWWLADTGIPDNDDIRILTNNGASQAAISNVNITMGNMVITLASPLASGENFTLVYDKDSATNKLTSNSGSEIPSFEQAGTHLGFQLSSTGDLFLDSGTASVLLKDALGQIISFNGTATPDLAAFTVTSPSGSYSVASVTLTQYGSMEFTFTPSMPAGTDFSIEYNPDNAGANPLTTSGGSVIPAFTIGSDGTVTSTTTTPDTGTTTETSTVGTASTSSLSEDGLELTLTLNDETGNPINLDTTKTPDAAAFTVSTDSGSRNVTNVTVSGNSVALRVDNAISVSEGRSVQYTKETAGTTPLTDTAGKVVENFTVGSVGTDTGTTTSDPITGGLTGSVSEDGKTITLSLVDGSGNVIALDENSVPATGSFTIMSGDIPINVNVVGIVNGQVILELADDTPVAAGMDLSISYDSASAGDTPLKTTTGALVTSARTNSATAIVNNSTDTNNTAEITKEVEIAEVEIAQEVQAATQATVANQGAQTQQVVSQARSRLSSLKFNRAVSPLQGLNTNYTGEMKINTRMNDIASPFSFVDTSFNSIATDTGDVTQLVYGNINIYEQKNGTWSAMFDAHAAWEHRLGVDTLAGYAIGGHAGYSHIEGNFSGESQSFGARVDGYIVHNLIDNIYVDAYASILYTRNNLSVGNDVLKDLDGAYNTWSGILGGSVTGSFTEGRFEFMPSLQVNYSTALSEEFDLEGTATVTIDENVSSTLRGVFEPEVQFGIDNEDIKAARSIFSMSPRVICDYNSSEGQEDDTECGGGAKIGFTRKSEDGKSTIKVQATRDYVGEVTRTEVGAKWIMNF